MLNAVLLRLLRSHAARSRRLSEDDLRDLASQKALELVERIVSHQWDLRDRSAGELVRYLTRVVENSIADELRRARRHRELDETTVDNAPGAGSPVEIIDGRGPEAGLEAKRYAASLVMCLNEIQPRSRLIWFLRTFYGFSSKEIASHPEVMIEPGHVDVIMMRVRKILTVCLERQGELRMDMPPGTYVAVWKSLDRARPSLAPLPSEPWADSAGVDAGTLG